MNDLLVCDDRYRKSKRRAYGDKVYAYFFVLNLQEDDIEYEFFTVIFIDSVLVSKAIACKFI